MANTVQSIGSFQAFISHPLINAGVKQQIRGLKLDSSFFDAAPEMENSKRIALIGGGPGAVDTAALTTTVQFGELLLQELLMDSIVEQNTPFHLKDHQIS